MGEENGRWLGNFTRVVNDFRRDLDDFKEQTMAGTKFFSALGKAAATG